VNHSLPLRRAVAALALLAAGAPAARAQDADSEPLRLVGVSGGIRNAVTESEGTVRLEVANRGAEAREARVSVFYAGHQDVQYARDLHLPPHTIVTTWMTLGPAPQEPSPFRRDVEVVLRDRTGGGDRLVLPAGQERVRSRPMLYRRREATTAVLLDPVELSDPSVARPPDPDDPVVLLRSLREGQNLTEAVNVISERFLPPVPEAFDAMDVLVLAGNQLAADPGGARGVRRWVQQGGTLWVLLDRVDPATFAPLLGDDADVEVIDRVGLTTVRLHRLGEAPGAGGTRDHERPVELVRVVPGAGHPVAH
jgi:hypothetical protein